MQLEILRLGSVVPNGVGGPGAAAINLIYTYLLQEHGITWYKFITVNQIGNDLQEGIVRFGPKDININVRYPASAEFQQVSPYERNLVRLEVIHMGLLELAKSDSRIDVGKLKLIKDEILKRKFQFALLYKQHVCKADVSLIAEIIIHPSESKFDFFAEIKQHDTEIGRYKIFSGKPIVFYVDALFFYGKWKGTNQLTISGKSPDVEIHVLVNEKRIEYINKSKYSKAPFFEMMKLDGVNADAAYADWIHSLPPEIAAVLEQSEN
jgi:hypothetical protein